MTGRTDTERYLDRIATALERIADAQEAQAVTVWPDWRPAGVPSPYEAGLVAAALDVATDTDDPEADALLTTAQDAIAKRLEQVTK